MSEEEEPNRIEEIIKALDFNLKSLEEARGITMADIKIFFLDLLGTVRDMWEQFRPFFAEMEKLKKIQDAAKKGEKYREEIPEANMDVKQMFL